MTNEEMEIKAAEVAATFKITPEREQQIHVMGTKVLSEFDSIHDAAASLVDTFSDPNEALYAGMVVGTLGTSQIFKQNPILLFQ